MSEAKTLWPVVVEPGDYAQPSVRKGKPGTQERLEAYRRFYADHPEASPFLLGDNEIKLDSDES